MELDLYYRVYKGKALLVKENCMELKYLRPLARVSLDVVVRSQKARQ